MRTCIKFLSVLVVLAICNTASGVPISASRGYQFLDNVSANNNLVGITPGLRQQFGATCVVLTGNPCTPQDLSNAAGTSGTATQAGTTLTLNFVASDLSSNHWNRTIRPPNNTLTGQWTLNFSNGANSAQTVTPSLQDATGAPAVVMKTADAPFIIPNGTTPSFGWTLPTPNPGSSIDAVTVLIRDESDIRNGVATLIYRNGDLPASTNSFTIQPNDPHFIGGRSLEPGKSYSIEIQLQDTRNNLPQGAFTNVLSQSRTFISFPFPTANVTGNPSGKIYLPIVDASGPVPVHRFSNVPVVAGQMIFIDPIVTVGFDYQTAPGDPNFRSVLLPTGFGDDLFDLWLWNGTDWFDTNIDLLAGSEFLFAPGGVDRFRITGIEASEGLDPAALGFVTGLTFVSDGTFSGSMTPLVADIAAVSEPAPLALITIALLGLVCAQRRRSLD